MAVAVVGLVSTTLCACSEIPTGRPEHIVTPVAEAAVSKPVGQAILESRDETAYEGIDLGAEILGRGSPYPMRVVGPLLAKTSRKGTKYCGRGYVVTNPIIISVCVSLADLREMHITSYRFVRFEKAEPNQVEQKLVYEGRSGEAARLSYKEFRGTSARPALDQELSFDLNGGDVLDVKGAKIKILEANNTDIRYQLIKGFD